jgi:hypothetical protein
MGQVFHRHARMTAAVHGSIRSSQESLIALAERCDITPPQDRFTVSVQDSTSS